VPTAQLGLTALGVGLMALGAVASQVRRTPPARRLVGLAALDFKKQDATTASQETAMRQATEVKEEVWRKQKKAAVEALTSQLERLDREERRTAAPTNVEQRTGGNLAQYDDTWHILREGETAPASATLSNCSIDVSASEYADASESLPDSGPRAWMSKSPISFEYRVVEVPRGELLDPAGDALIFDHLPFGSPERQAAEGKAQRRLVIIDETVGDLYGAKVRAYFEARGVVHEIMRLPMVKEEKSMETTLKVCKNMKEFNNDPRTEPVLAIGGGVCLDVAGLAASLFRRRTPYIRVPTTTLSYVGASVGAKNGCNFAGSKLGHLRCASGRAPRQLLLQDSGGT